jgi:hypothetical protein
VQFTPTLLTQESNFVNTYWLQQTVFVLHLGLFERVELPPDVGLTHVLMPMEDIFANTCNKKIIPQASVSEILGHITLEM